MLQSRFPKYRIELESPLLYRLIVDGEGGLKPSDYHNPRRDDLAFFHTDILVSNERVPLVVIETKYEGLNTDGVLAYSVKAKRHKEVYPYLRYGLLVGGTDRIERKFFVHNIGSVFDFAMAVEDVDSGSAEVVELLRKQLQAAESLLGVERTERIRKYTSTIEVN